VLFYFVTDKRKTLSVDAEEKTMFFLYFFDAVVRYQKFSHFDSIVHARSSHGRKFSIGCDVARCG
jgi:hypothetical protein